MRSLYRTVILMVACLLFMPGATVLGVIIFEADIVPTPNPAVIPEGGTIDFELHNVQIEYVGLPDDEYEQHPERITWKIVSRETGQMVNYGNGRTAHARNCVRGSYEVIFTAEGETPDDTATLSMPFHVVAVSSLSCENVSSTTSTSGDNETLVVPVGYNNGFVTLTATPTLSGTWPAGKPTWSENVLSCNGATATLSTTNPGTYTITATCGATISINIIVFSVNIFAETSDGIVNDGTKTSLSECMEGRHITYTAKLSEQIPTNLNKTYTFFFKASSGETWTAIVISTDNTVYYTAQTDQVANSPMEMTHKYSTPIYCTATISGKTAISSTINVDVYELWIKEFKDTATGKAWKVCVGRDISYEAISSSDCVNWNWDMEEGIPDAWNPTGGNAKSGTTMKIPYSDLSRASNSWFGNEYGEVNVSCKDAEGNF